LGSASRRQGGGRPFLAVADLRCDITPFHLVPNVGRQDFLGDLVAIHGVLLSGKKIKPATAAASS
jgi:hypothetical protein